jgi:hypothetical protein
VVDFFKNGPDGKQLDRWLYDEALFFVEDGKPIGRRAHSTGGEPGMPRWALKKRCAHDGAAKRLDIPDKSELPEIRHQNRRLR